MSNVCHLAIKPKIRPLHRAPKGCPCTPQLLCSTDERGVFNEFCDIPRAPVSTFSMHGGAGGIMSVGLMRAVSFDFMEMCVKSLYSTGKLYCPSGHHLMMQVSGACTKEARVAPKLHCLELHIAVRIRTLK